MVGAKAGFGGIRGYIVRKSMGQPFVESNTEKIETTVSKDSRANVHPKYT